MFLWSKRLGYQPFHKIQWTLRPTLLPVTPPLCSLVLRVPSSATPGCSFLLSRSRSVTAVVALEWEKICVCTQRKMRNVIFLYVVNDWIKIWLSSNILEGWWEIQSQTFWTSLCLPFGAQTFWRFWWVQGWLCWSPSPVLAADDLACAVSLSRKMLLSQCFE